MRPARTAALALAGAAVLLLTGCVDGAQNIGDAAAPAKPEQLELTVSSTQSGTVACRITWGVAIVVNTATGDRPVARCRARVHRIPA
jgi:hypothetical protein